MYLSEMFKFKGLVASSAKKVNENAGYATPLRKNFISRKNLFSDKPKVVLGDVKNSAFNIKTPKSEKTKLNPNRYPNNIFLSTPRNENVKLNTTFNVQTPRTKSSHSILFLSTPKVANVKTNFGVATPKLGSNLDNQCDEKFKLLFLEPNENLDPSTPQALKQEQPHVDLGTTITSVLDITGYGSIGELNDDDFPPINESIHNLDTHHSHSTLSSNCSENDWDEYGAWHEKPVLSDEHFKLLFLEPNENLAPPTPPSPKQERQNSVYLDLILPGGLETSDYGSICEIENDDIPPVNISMDFFDVNFWDDMEK